MIITNILHGYKHCSTIAEQLKVKFKVFAQLGHDKYNTQHNIANHLCREEIADLTKMQIKKLISIIAPSLTQAQL